MPGVDVLAWQKMRGVFHLMITILAMKVCLGYLRHPRDGEYVCVYVCYYIGIGRSVEHEK